MYRCGAISKKNSILRKNHKINRRIDYWNLAFVEVLQDADNLYECPQCHKKNSTNTFSTPYLKVMNFRISMTICIYCGYRFQQQSSLGRPKNRFDYRFYDGSENVA
ncbi:uncharacterized protein LOC123309161 [Coccinella septempunctata]|uniref:uncharacterized protein LOC123309161 n=1 Tax=Coccinella septempunctata TaxID=41139 RepID=UPI001D0844E4|nr:uncharacterized protein LOC123309161 [Coccinella septempunctata]